MLAVDLRFPNPKLLKREFIELISYGRREIRGRGGKEKKKRAWRRQAQGRRDGFGLGQIADGWAGRWCGQFEAVQAK